MNVKEKSISYAFLRIIDVKGMEWKYTKMEKEFGRHLAKYVKKLLVAEGNDYENIMNELVKEIG